MNLVSGVSDHIELPKFDSLPAIDDLIPRKDSSVFINASEEDILLGKIKLLWNL